MGYHLTESASDSRKRTAPFSSGTPKTHTTGSALQERGLRYYKPGLGMWLNRDPIGERGGEGLFAFTHNSPIVNHDALGEISETIVKNHNPEFISKDKCTGSGGFQAPGDKHEFTQWTLSSGQNNGYIVQHVITTRIYENCDGSDRQTPAPFEFWEAWSVENGVVKVWPVPSQLWKTEPYDIDQLWVPDTQAEKCGTKGSIVSRYEAAFYTGVLISYIPTPSSWGVTGAPPGGQLLVHGASPAPTFSPSITMETSKSVGYTWRCCDCNRKRTLLWIVGNTSGNLYEQDSKPCP